MHAAESPTSAQAPWAPWTPRARNSCYRIHRGPRGEQGSEVRLASLFGGNCSVTTSSRIPDPLPALQAGPSPGVDRRHSTAQKEKHFPVTTTGGTVLSSLLPKLSASTGRSSQAPVGLPTRGGSMRTLTKVAGADGQQHLCVIARAARGCGDRTGSGAGSAGQRPPSMLARPCKSSDLGERDRKPDLGHVGEGLAGPGDTPSSRCGCEGRASRGRELALVLVPT